MSTFLAHVMAVTFAPPITCAESNYLKELAGMCGVADEILAGNMLSKLPATIESVAHSPLTHFSLGAGWSIELGFTRHLRHCMDSHLFTLPHGAHVVSENDFISMNIAKKAPLVAAKQPA